jgi:hypothetical protein
MRLPYNCIRVSFSKEREANLLTVVPLRSIVSSICLSSFGKRMK